VDNQELVICSDMFTYVSLAQGQTLQYENDKSSIKDLITHLQKLRQKALPLFPLAVLVLCIYSANI
jgi:hypothetical protein